MVLFFHNQILNIFLKLDKLIIFFYRNFFMKMGKNENADIIQFIKKQIINNNYKSQQNPIFFEDKNINKEINEEKIKQLRNYYNIYILFINKK